MIKSPQLLACTKVTPYHGLTACECVPCLLPLEFPHNKYDSICMPPSPACKWGLVIHMDVGHWFTILALQTFSWALRVECRLITLLVLVPVILMSFCVDNGNSQVLGATKHIGIVYDNLSIHYCWLMIFSFLNVWHCNVHVNAVIYSYLWASVLTMR